MINENSEPKKMRSVKKSQPTPKFFSFCSKCSKCSSFPVRRAPLAVRKEPFEERSIGGLVEPPGFPNDKCIPCLIQDSNFCLFKRVNFITWLYCPPLRPPPPPQLYFCDERRLSKDVVKRNILCSIANLYQFNIYSWSALALFITKSHRTCCVMIMKIHLFHRFCQISLA